MPESETTPNLKLRLSFDGLSKEDIDQWENDLVQKGVEIVSRSTIGLDVEGPKEQLQAALEITITIDGDDVRVEDSVTSESLGAKPRPRMYVPRRPTLF